MIDLDAAGRSGRTLLCSTAALALATVTATAPVIANAQGVDDDGRRGRGGSNVGSKRDSFYLSAKVSTLGVGVDFSRSLANRFAFRVGYSGFSTSFDETESGIDYDIDLDLRSFAVSGDWHPWQNGVFLTGGALINNNEANALGNGDGVDITIGDLTFDAGLVGDLTAQVDFDDVAPMVGFGWNSAFAKRRLGVVLSAGVVFQGEPRVTLQADGAIADDPLFQQELQREQDELQEDLNDFTLYPVASFGLSYRF
ncbi:MAG: hypothetical protein AAGA68_17240 [Pseudomonadota bacterium]